MHVVEANIRQCVVPNRGGWDESTNAYIIGSDPVVVVDPGSADGVDVVCEALDELGNPAVRDIILTHVHPDHSGGAAALREASGAPVSLHPAEFVERDERGWTVPVDRQLEGGELIGIDELEFEAVLTPGHAVGHLVFVERRTRLTLAGDLVHGAGTIGIFPPFGSMCDYLDSLQRLREYGVSKLLPGHGPIIEDGPAALHRYLEHRRRREAEILDLVQHGMTTVDELVSRLYPDIVPHLRRAAASTVTAHLDKLVVEGYVEREASDPQPVYRCA